MDKKPPERESLQGRRVLLEVLGSETAGRLYAIATSEPILHYWPLRGRPVQKHEFIKSLQVNSALLLAVRSRTDGATLGTVIGYRFDRRSGIGYLAYLFDEVAWSKGWLVEAMLLSINHCFQVVGLRKIYFEMTTRNRDRVSSAVGRWIVPEALLPRHRYESGRYTDLHIYSIAAGDWDARFVSWLLRGSQR